MREIVPPRTPSHTTATRRCLLTPICRIRVEFFGLPRTDDSFGRFFGASVGSTESPFPYGRVLAGVHAGRARDLQATFLQGISHPRFEQLKRATGAYQGSKPSPINELADTFHIWCAETAVADVFVTMDEDLVSLVRRHRTHPPRVRVLLPSEAVQLARDRGLFSQRDYPSYRTFRRLLLREGSDHPLEDWVRIGRGLESSSYYDSDQRESRLSRVFWPKGLACFSSLLRRRVAP